MAVAVHIPIAWRKKAGGNAVVKVKEATVHEIFLKMELLYPSLKGHLLQGGVAHPALNILVNGEDIRLLNGLHTYVASDSELQLIPEFGKG